SRCARWSGRRRGVDEPRSRGSCPARASGAWSGFRAVSALPLRLRRPDLAGLARLAADVLAGVLHALRLVRVGLAEPADLRGALADGLLVDARGFELLRRLDGERHACRWVDLDRVREAEGARELLPLGRG